MDEISWTIQTADGGYLLGGSVYSGIGGDKTQDNWDITYNTYDFWVVKTDSLGNKQWDKRFGGFSDDGIGVSSIRQTKDNGFILGGISSSDSGGDKTQACWGGFDYWMVKIDSNGNKMWDKRLGGTNEELLWCLQITADGGYILGGYSHSGISGDKTQDNWDISESTADYWIVKTDSLGNKQWDKRYGGTDDDELTDLIQTRDGGYILVGGSASDSSGDKTQNNWAPGNYNYWIVKTDSAGNQLWDKRFGGNAEDEAISVVETPDDGFVIGGISNSNISGDKTQNTQGGDDYWIIKIDSLGNKLWDKDYGGTRNDDLSNLVITSDGGILLAGNSESSIGGDKMENNVGARQTWLIKTDSAGNKLWDKTIFVNGPAITSNAFQTQDGCYLIGSWTAAEPGYYKTQASWDSSADYWIVKFRDTTIITGIKDITTNLQLNVYPNPFTNELDITLAQQNLKQADFSICNMLGQTVYTQHETNLSPSYTKMLDLSYLPNGVYLVEVVVDGEVGVREVVKQ